MQFFSYGIQQWSIDRNALDLHFLMTCFDLHYFGETPSSIIHNLYLYRRMLTNPMIQIPVHCHCALIVGSSCMTCVSNNSSHPRFIRKVVKGIDDLSRLERSIYWHRLSSPFIMPYIIICLYFTKLYLETFVL